MASDGNHSIFSSEGDISAIDCTANREKFEVAQISCKYYLDETALFVLNYSRAVIVELFLENGSWKFIACFIMLFNLP